MISKTHKTIFIHIPKVAGQSIETMFLQDLNLDWAQRDQLLLRKKKLTEKGPYRLAHLKAEEYTKLNYIDLKDFESYFKFSFVRNPFSRAYSYYKYLGYSKVCDYNVFLTDVLAKKIKSKHFFFISQTDYLFDSNNNILVDFVGKFEKLNEDIKVVIEKAHLKTQTLPYVNKSKTELKRSISKIIKTPTFLTKLKTNNPIYKDYREAYNKEAVEIVSKLYKDDIKNFEYCFDA
jgi:hypothetical protein